MIKSLGYPACSFEACLVHVAEDGYRVLEAPACVYEIGLAMDWIDRLGCLGVHGNHTGGCTSADPTWLLSGIHEGQFSLHGSSLSGAFRVTCIALAWASICFRSGFGACSLLTRTCFHPPPTSNPSIQEGRLGLIDPLLKFLSPIVLYFGTAYP